LAGARALVTGASRGIGRAVAQLFLERGARVALSARDKAALEAVAAGHPKAVVLAADLSSPDAMAALVARASGALGGLDVLVAAAGVARYQPVDDVDAPTLEQQLRLNFVAPFFLAQAAAARMAPGGGAIVVVTSTLVEHPAPSTAAYAASKGALTAMMKSFALELAGRGIRVNAVAPGVVDTAMIRAPRVPGEDVDARLDALRNLHPLDRLGRPRDVAEAVTYLVGANFVTGTVHCVDGGLSLGQGRD
jgi:NAD(P)-dependent dehydrogenase (short-subunit alcohol dehydrogenase family)